MEFLDWDLIDYDQAMKRQLALVDAVAGGTAADAVILCRHPAVVTLGRNTKKDEVAGWTGAIREVSRGGRATYHGPSQIVIYPILDLKRNRAAVRSRDLHGYMRAMEQAVCSSLREIGIQDAEARRPDSDDLSLTGVWVGKRKIASIGIAVRKWVVYHGCAVNIEKDPQAFVGIRPCGFQSSVMTSVEELLGRPYRPEMTQALIRNLRSSFSIDAVDSANRADNVK